MYVYIYRSLLVSEISHWYVNGILNPSPSFHIKHPDCMLPNECVNPPLLPWFQVSMQLLSCLAKPKNDLIPKRNDPWHKSFNELSVYPIFNGLI